MHTHKALSVFSLSRQSPSGIVEPLDLMPLLFEPDVADEAEAAYIISVSPDGTRQRIAILLDE